MKAYYGSRFSPNMTKTPEDYLICHNVPIARTGWYEYLGQELGQDEYYDKVVKVYRSPEEVFSQASIASFEGKPVTDNHPSDDVRPDNYNSYLKGITTNVRKGTGENEDCLVADLIIYDPLLQSEINAGKREISCGYDCDYEEVEEGQYQQRQIRGNHVAVVTNGRAGNRIAIKDSKTETERSKTMAKTGSIFGRMFAAFAKDAEPDEIAKAVDELVSNSGEEADPEAKVTDEGDDVGARLDRIEAILSRLVESDEEVHEEIPQEDDLETLENELSSKEETEDLEITGSFKDVEGEESATISPEKIDDEAPEAEEGEKPMNPTANDRNALLNTVRAMKPVIAAMSNPAERKKATDALVKSVRSQMATKDSNKGYAGITKAIQANVIAKAKDSESTKQVDLTGLGKEIAKKYNPHYKEVK